METELPSSYILGEYEYSESGEAVSRKLYALYSGGEIWSVYLPHAEIPIIESGE